MSKQEPICNGIDYICPNCGNSLGFAFTTFLELDKDKVCKKCKQEIDWEPERKRIEMEAELYE